MSVYKIVQERIIEKLERAIKEGGTAPWQMPWSGGCVNYVTRRAYNGINLLLLSRGGEYITFKQIQKLQEKDASIKLKKGAKSEIVVFWTFINKESKNDDGENVERTIPLLKYYRVFHIDSVEGIESKFTDDTVTSNDEVEKVFKNYMDREGISFKTINGGNKAYYSPSKDEVVMPCLQQFKSTEHYLSVFAHELAHSTGHQKRLVRFKNDNVAFADENYSKEELVAEISANMLLSTLNVDTSAIFDNSISYLKSWISVIKNDIKFVLNASTQAQKATDFILEKDSLT